MSKYVDLAVKNAKEEQDVKAQAEQCGAILSSRIEGQIKYQEADIVEKTFLFKEAEDNVLKAQSFLTKNVDSYLSGYKAAVSRRDVAAEELQLAQDNLDSLKELMKIFS